MSYRYLSGVYTILNNFIIQCDFTANLKKTLYENNERLLQGEVNLEPNYCYLIGTHNYYEIVKREWHKCTIIINNWEIELIWKIIVSNAYDIEFMRINIQTERLWYIY